MHCPNCDSTQLVDRLLLEQLSLALSLSFSKRIEDHIGVIGYFIHHHNLSITQTIYSSPQKGTTSHLR